MCRLQCSQGAADLGLLAQPSLGASKVLRCSTLSSKVAIAGRRQANAWPIQFKARPAFLCHHEQELFQIGLLKLRCGRWSELSKATTLLGIEGCACLWLGAMLCGVRIVYRTCFSAYACTLGLGERMLTEGIWRLVG